MALLAALFYNVRRLERLFIFCLTRKELLDGRRFRNHTMLAAIGSRG